MNILLKCARGVVLFTLGFTVPLIAALTVGWITNGFFGWVDRLTPFLLSALILLFPLVLLLSTGFLIARYERRITWKHLGVTTALVAPVMIYLGWDEPAAATPLNVEALAPPPARAAESYALSLWFPRSPDEREAARWPPTIPAYLAKQLQAAEWRVFVMANRDAIRADWEACTAVRDWIIRLDAFEVIGDLTASLGTPESRIRYWTFNDTCVLHCAYASLLAIEGRGDEALAVLRPMLSVSRKLKPAARTVTRYVLTGGRGQRLCQNAVRFVLHTTTPATEALRPIGAVLAPAEDLAANYRRVLLCDYAFDPRNSAAIAPKLSPILIPLYNPNATDNLMLRHYRDLLNVANEGRSEGFGAHERVAAQRALDSRAFKNVFGRYLVRKIADNRDWMVKDSLATEDARRALLAEVQQRLAAAEKKEAAAATKSMP